MRNSLDLDPEWGAIDLIEDVEATFGFTLTNEEAEPCATVGDLYEVICAHTPAWDAQEGSCSSSMVFYRMRRSLYPGDRRGFTPETALCSSGLQPSHLFKKLADETGLRLPAYELTWLGMTGAVILIVGIIAAVVALFTGHWMLSGLGILIALCGVPLAKLDPGRFPSGVVTMADLVRRTVPLNSIALTGFGARPADRWTILTALAAEHGNLPPDEIGPETFFHRASLEVATAR